MTMWVQYGAAVDLYIPIPKAGSTDFAVAADWTPAAGDVKVIIDGTDNGNIATLPTAVTGRAAWKIPLSAAEVTGKRILVVIVDSATKVIVDQAVAISTFGHHAAADTRGIIRRATLQAAAADTATLDASASAVDDFYNGCKLRIVGGTGAGQERQIIGYVGATKVASVYVAGIPIRGAQWVTTPDNTSIFEVIPESIIPAPIALSAGVAQAEVVKIAGEDITGAGTSGDPWRPV